MKYINWREEPDPGKPKPKKVPFSVALGKRIDPHQPDSWLTWEEVSQNGYPIGIVLTDDDPYFLLDLDACRDPLTGQWTPEAVEIASLFPGAAMEISHNMTGAHIMGMCDPSVLGERRNKFKYGLGQLECEFYHTGRFVALGHGMQGDINLDWTNTLASLVPIREIVDTVELTEQVDPSYTGPEDDDKLIQLMLNASGSADQQFGTKATVVDLWNGNEEALSRFFPSGSEDVFDRSSADMALLSHLAFYTGKNPARMDRLFRRSALCRPKYLERPKYAIDSISQAVGGCHKVYDRERVDPVQVESALSHKSQARRDEFPEILSLQEQVDYFAGCVYVSRDHAVMVPGGTLLKPPAFKSLYGGHQFLMSSDGGRPTFNAFEAFTENRVIRQPKVYRTRFLPTVEPGAIVGDGVNVYFPEEIETAPGDVQPFTDLLNKLLPVERDRQILLAYMASLVQNPGKKFLWAPVLQGTKGNGKDFIASFLIYAMGEKYSWTPKAAKIDAKFNTFIQNRTFINVSEMHMFNKFDMLETLKDYITESRQEIEGKGSNAEMTTDYCANWFFCTNHKDAMIKEKDDRRFAIFFTAQQSLDDLERCGMMGTDYFPKLWDWARNGGYAFVRHFLLNYDIPFELDPASGAFRAPVTSSTEEAISTSLGVAEQYILEGIEQELTGFRGGWLSTWAVNNLLRKNNIVKHPRNLGSIIERMGYVNKGRATSTIMEEENTRPTLWYNESVGQGLDYEVAQGYSKPNIRVA